MQDPLRCLILSKASAFSNWGKLLPTHMAVCTENINSNVVVMKSAK
jgi:hypothetical protein